MTGEASERTVVIAGGGPAGSTAALLLGALGWWVTVVEERPAGAPMGAGILLQPNGLAVLYGLGLREALQRKATLDRDGTLRRADDRPLGRIAVPDFGSGLDHALVLHRGHLAAVLDGAMAVHPRIDVRRGASVRSATPGGIVTIDDGTIERQMTADLVVGADGVRSLVRATGDFGGRVRATRHTYARWVVPFEDAPAAQWWSGLGVFGCAPLGDGRCYGFASVSHPAVRAHVEARDLSGFARLWRSHVPASGPVLGRVASFDDLLINEGQVVRCRRMVDGRTVLIGDAAHAMVPNVGQGANTALVDAAELALQLSGAAEQSAALAAYQRARRRPAIRVQRQAQAMAMVEHLRQRHVRWARDTAVGFVTRTPLMERQARRLQQVDPERLLRQVEALVA